MSSTAKPSTPNHYQVLQLSPGATDQELRQAFRGLSKRYHPDTTTLPAAEAEAAFRQLRQSYARAQRSRRAGGSTTPGCSGPTPPLPVRRTQPAVVSRPVPVRRALSGGEWFALLLLAVALVLCLVLGIGVAWARGAEMMAWPSWWADLEQASAPNAHLSSTAPPPSREPPAAPAVQTPAAPAVTEDPPAARLPPAPPHPPAA